MRKLVLMTLMLAMAAGMWAKKKPTDYYGKGRGKVYVFGVSQQLTDSVIYITNIQEVDSIDLDSKTKFLPFRSEFSMQLKEYLEGKQKLHKQTSCVFYSSSRKKISKKFYKIKKRFLDNTYTKIKVIDESLFRFRHPLDSFAVEE